MNRLAGKTAVVTGGSVGIGRACVIRMAEEGARVAILDMLETDGKALTADLTAAGHEVAFWAVDVADEAAMKATIDAAAARFGGLHVLVNNAGISGSPKPTDQVTEAEWDRVQAVNVKGVFFGTKEFLSSSTFLAKHGIKGGIEGKDVIVQGFGNVGYFSAKFFSEGGARVVRTFCARHVRA